MIDLVKATAKIYAERDKNIEAVRKQFSEDQMTLSLGEQTMVEDHQKQLNDLQAKLQKELVAFIAKQEQMFADLQNKQAVDEEELGKKAEIAVGELDVAYQADLKAKADADVKEAAAKAEKLSDENILIKEMTGLTAEEIKDDYKRSQSVSVAKHLGISHSGRELEIAERIVAKLKEVK